MTSLKSNWQHALILATLLYGECFTKNQIGNFFVAPPYSALEHTDLRHPQGLRPERCGRLQGRRGSGRGPWTPPWRRGRPGTTWCRPRRRPCTRHFCPGASHEAKLKTSVGGL